MKQVRLKVKVLSEVDMATHFINWDKWLHEELEQKGSDEWQSVGVYDLDDRNDRISADFPPATESRLKISIAHAAGIGSSVYSAKSLLVVAFGVVCVTIIITGECFTTA